MHHSRKVPSRLGLCLAAFGCLALASCGDGANRHRVQGKVTFQGKPVESGAIFFEPTASAGKVAATVYLPIRDGKFDTGDKGPHPGKYRVVVGGVDKSKSKVDDDGVNHSAQLFKDYVFEVDIPPANNTLDIEVPAAQALSKQ